MLHFTFGKGTVAKKGKLLRRREGSNYFDYPLEAEFIETKIFTKTQAFLLSFVESVAICFHDFCVDLQNWHKMNPDQHPHVLSLIVW